ncbi:hypothetical protein N657DRAFT_640822 [Parathielavia appendiculata]|uniref:Uncharacterized protein n=1 Tax=Parathielavia appendiculata TaxID=2587402 RepID=A0AAN6U5P4_9PEZI|nr:hypothetical protein N657DRAFT_640822 [Parathielavia appendiculata]
MQYCGGTGLASFPLPSWESRAPLYAVAGRRATPTVKLRSRRTGQFPSSHDDRGEPDGHPMRRSGTGRVVPWHPGPLLLPEQRRTLRRSGGHWKRGAHGFRHHAGQLHMSNPAFGCRLLYPSNAVYWAVSLLPRRAFWDMGRVSCRGFHTPADAANAHNDSVTSPDFIEGCASLTRTLWYAIREVDPQRESRKGTISRRRTNGKGGWLRHASCSKGTEHGRLSKRARNYAT